MYWKLSLFLLILVSFVVFFVSSSYNYAQHVAMKYAVVDHPEFIPSHDSVRLTAGGFDNIVADFYWLSAIQYIGTNAISGEYKRYLYAMLSLVTDLNPHFTYPYEIGELLLPSYNYRYENLSDAEIQKNTDQGFQIGLKGVKNNCDAAKVELARNELDVGKLWTDAKYKNPCTDAMIPYYLGYIAYWNQKDAKKASEYYRITAANEDAPMGARTMAAIMQGKTGSREKAIVMFLSLAQNVDGKKKTSCAAASKELGDILSDAFTKKQQINGRFLQQVEMVRQSIVRELEEEWVDPSKDGNIEQYCSTYLNKSVREMNLSYIETADAKYFADKNKHADTPKDLFQSGYIDYVPSDFQKTDAGGLKQGIVYYYNGEIKAWDYKMDQIDE